MTQPIALFLADILEDGGKPADIAEKAAAELRRLHAELERCKQVCAATSEAWREEAALAEPVEPVAWRYQDARGNYRYRGYVQGFDKEYSLLKPVPLYSTPPQRKPLTEEEIKECERQAMVNGSLPFEQRVFFARAIERTHGIK